MSDTAPKPEQTSAPSAPTTPAAPAEPSLPALTGIYVEGFKSFAPLSDAERDAAYKFMAQLDAADRGEGEYPFKFGEPVRMKGWYPVRPLTVLCGKNGSGKSSLLQALLLLKRSLQWVHDGRITIASNDNELPVGSPLAWGGSGALSLGASVDGTLWRSVFASPANSTSLELRSFHLQSDKTGSMVRVPGEPYQDVPDGLNANRIPNNVVRNVRWEYRALRHFVVPQIIFEQDGGRDDASVPFGSFPELTAYFRFDALARGIHYKRAFSLDMASYDAANNRSVSGEFSAPLDKTTLMDLAHHQALLQQVNRDLGRLGFFGVLKITGATGTPLAYVENGTTIALASVASGIRAVLPALCGLQISSRQEILILEEPELHLHPAAQAAMADLIVDAVKRGVRVIVETHSDIMLLRMQTLLAKGELKPGDSVFHWFEKNGQGATEVQSVFPDAAGRVGGWNNDFADVRAHANDDYLDASFERLTGEPPAGQHE